jgi:CHAD domain-containing protein
MAYQIAEHEEFDVGVRRIALEQIDLALERLTPAPDNVDEAVHTVRQAFKRIRALLTLVWDDLGQGVFQEEDRCYRDAGRHLAGARDAAVVVETLEALTGQFSQQLAPGTFDGIRLALERSRDARVERVIGEEKALWKTAELLATARERVPTWPSMSDELAALHRGLRPSYREGRRGLATVKREPSARNFHEWRKPVKVLWYHLQLIAPCWPEIIDAFAHEFHHLSDCLNANHDLAVLRQAAHGPEVKARPHELEALTALIDERCAELEAEASRLGERLYAEESGMFVTRVERYWKVWRAEQASAVASAH